MLQVTSSFMRELRQQFDPLQLPTEARLCFLEREIRHAERLRTLKASKSCLNIFIRAFGSIGDSVSNYARFRLNSV